MPKAESNDIEEYINPRCLPARLPIQSRARYEYTVLVLDTSTQSPCFIVPDESRVSVLRTSAQSPCSIRGSTRSCGLFEDALKL